jgi:hypothetical protein
MIFIKRLIYAPEPEDLFALRLYANDILVAYNVTSRAPNASLLKAIISAIVSLPKLPSTVQISSAIDKATFILLKKNGVSGFAFVASANAPVPLEDNPSELLEWAMTNRPLAIPNNISSERQILMARRSELLDGITLALLEPNAALAATALRWLSVMKPRNSERRLILAGIHRASQLGVGNIQTCFDCCFASRILQES